MPENRILLVEDEATSREILTHVLRGEGYSVDLVATAGAATTCLRSIPYALAIADWVLPDGDGIDAAAVEFGCKTMIVTGYRSNLPVGAAERHQLFTKPVTPALAAAVRGAIGEPGYFELRLGTNSQFWISEDQQNGRPRRPERR